MRILTAAGCEGFAARLLPEFIAFIANILPDLSRVYQFFVAISI